MGTIKSVNSVGEGSFKLVNETLKANIKTMYGVSGFAAAGLQCESIDSIGKLTEVNQLHYGTNATDGGVPRATADGGGFRSGIVKDAGTGTGWTSGAITVAELQSDNEGYIEMNSTESLESGYHWTFMIGLGYKDDAVTSGTSTYAWIDYAFAYFEVNSAIYESGVLKKNVVLDYPVDRKWRVNMVTGTVDYRYSDDDFSTETIFYTSDTAVDISGNSNLVGAFSIAGRPSGSIYGSPAGAGSVCFEDVKLCGDLTGV